MAKSPTQPFLGSEYVGMLTIISYADHTYIHTVHTYTQYIRIHTVHTYTQYIRTHKAIRIASACGNGSLVPEEIDILPVKK